MNNTIKLNEEDKGPYIETMSFNKTFLITLIFLLTLLLIVIYNRNDIISIIKQLFK